jgi:outer membrane lipoprotein-sorting protein
MSVSTPQKEKGKFYLEKPDRMRWEYRPPDEKIFIYKAGALEEYYPEDKQLIRRFLAGEQNEAETLALLAGRKRIQDNYLIEETLFPSDNKSSRQLKLTPNQEGEYSYILLEIDERTWLIRRAIFFEWTGNKMEFLFSKMKANAPLPSGIFDLKVPPDCEIIEDDSLRKK